MLGDRKFAKLVTRDGRPVGDARLMDLEELIFGVLVWDRRAFVLEDPAAEPLVYRETERPMWQLKKNDVRNRPGQL